LAHEESPLDSIRVSEHWLLQTVPRWALIRSSELCSLTSKLSRTPSLITHQLPERFLRFLLKMFIWATLRKCLPKQA
jgi:hypothetical protein